MSTTAAALRALASHVLPRMEDAPRGIGVHLDTPWTGEGSLHVGAREVPLIWCESTLAAREAMVAREQIPKPWFLLTPLRERELGDDVLARLFRCRLLPLDRWRILRDRLGAHRIDPRLSRFSWLAEAMLEVLPQSGAKVASGFLDAATAWGILLEGYFGLHEPRPDLRALLAWSRTAEASAWSVRPSGGGPEEPRVGPELLQEASAWIRQSAGEAGARILAVAHDGRARDALPLGVVMDLVFGGRSDDPDLRVAAARLERFVGNRPVPVAVGRHWGREAAASLRREIRGGGSVEGVLQRAQAIALEIDLGEASAQSRLLPSGLAWRWKALASALGGSEVPALDRALTELREHELVGAEERETARLLARLKSWLLLGGREVPASLPGFGKWALAEGCWVDRLRNGLRARSLPPAVEPAARVLLGEADRRRQDLNRAFGQQLAGWLGSGARAGGPTLESERLIPEVLAPLAASGPVLLVLLDGLTSNLLFDLLDGLRDQGWRELAPEATTSRRLLVAPLPTVTEVTRCSLLAGRLLRGRAAAETQAFSQHPGLVAASTARRPPRLFHKGALEDDAMLSSELREVLLETDQRVVGVVVNAIDEQLSGSGQISLRWTDSIIRPLRSLLTVAGQAGRRVVLAGDHGHVLENDSECRRHRGGARWRQVTGEPAVGEVLLEGPRVLVDGERILAPWSEKVRYVSGKSAGYHGGASPQEVLVPFAVLAAGEPPSGWLEVEAEPPLWWTGEEALAPVGRDPVARDPAEATAAAPPEKDPDESQLDLFSPPAEPAAEPSHPEPPWIGQLMASEVLAQQRPLAGRAGLDEDLMRRLLTDLERRGGRATRPALARSIGYPAARLRGFVALVQKLLNVEGFPVLEVDEASATVVLNRELLLTQFELDR